MGPYSEARQLQRAEAIKKILENPKLDKMYKLIWKKHLDNLAINEDEYNARVRSVYSVVTPRFKVWNSYV